MSAPALFEVDDFAPVTVKVMSCASCIGQGVRLTGETCSVCGGDRRIGSSIWRGGTCLARIVTDRPDRSEGGAR